MNERYYRLSGRLPMVGAVLTIVLGLSCSALLGYLYGAVSYYSPLIYLNFLGTLAVGFIPAIVIEKLSHKLKIRNKPFLVSLSIVSGLVAIYMSWAGYIFVLFVAEKEIDFSLFTAFSIIGSPLGIGQLISVIATVGVWGIKDFTPTGITLYILWTIEAGMIFVINVFSTPDLSTPFCEDCDCWTNMHDDAPFLSRRPTEELKTNLEQENYKYLDDMLKEEADPMNCFVSVFHLCPQCEESNYLTVTHVTLTPNKEGEFDSKTEDVIKNLIIPHTLVETFTGKAKALEQLREQQAIEAMNNPQSDNDEEDNDEEEEFPELDLK